MEQFILLSMGEQVVPSQNRCLNRGVGARGEVGGGNFGVKVYDEGCGICLIIHMILEKIYVIHKT